MISPAGPTRAPNASPMLWCPRQTPRSGTTPAAARIRSIEIPASAGVHGPGETTIRSAPIARQSSTLASSLRTTSTVAPSSERYW